MSGYLLPVCRSTPTQSGAQCYVQPPKRIGKTLKREVGVV